MGFKKNELILSQEMDNGTYHGDKSCYSSSQLKQMIKDPEVFHSMYITGSLVKKIATATQTAFDIGSYFHTAVLEPHLLEKEYLVVDVERKAGKVWKDAVKKGEDMGLIVITKGQMETAMFLAKGVQDSPIAMSLIEREGVIVEGSIFSDLIGVPVKKRSDLMFLSTAESYILDLKSTTGSVKNAHSIKNKIQDLDYDLSAALYVDIVNKYIAVNDLPYAPVDTFYWTFASKDNGVSKTYASTEKMLEVGRAKVYKALNLIKKYEELNWEFVDEIECLDPPPWVVTEWLENNGDEGTKYAKSEKLQPSTELDIL